MPKLTQETLKEMQIALIIVNPILFSSLRFQDVYDGKKLNKEFIVTLYREYIDKDVVLWEE